MNRRPQLAVIVVAFDMARELPRTLYSLSRAYQRGVENLEYEILVVDNGSPEPLDPAVLDGLDGDFRLHRIDPAPPSPAHAGNLGVAMTSAPYVALVLDGARMISPGVVAAAIESVERRERAVVTPIAFHLGTEHQSVSIAKGYGPAGEDEALASVGWTTDGYKLFTIASLAGANPGGYSGDINESCFLVTSRALWNEIGGLEERFDLPGGGLVSLDVFSRLVDAPNTELVVLLGEGSFHQVHGGASTSPGADHERWHEQYKQIRGSGYVHPRVQAVHEGALGPWARAFVGEGSMRVASARRTTPTDREQVPVSTDPTGETPLRALAARHVDGVRIVRETGQGWLDGSEDILFERLTTSGLPLDSLSDELFATATNWPERYHLSPSRANAIRALDLPHDARVLEIGAGCGAITRYLGETCALVDALEPTFQRARVAAARTAELPGVRVFNCELSDLPDEQTYDLVVVVGVLEYVGNGGDDDAPYVSFLEQLRRVLRPGGQLVLAIENQLGVKYLAGAPEDHSGQVFHSVEGYPVDGPARTFSRRRLGTLFSAAGFESTRVLGAFPDYKLTRLVMAEELLGRAPALAVNAPHFPSPDWVVPRPVLLDESLLWKELVAAGVGMDFVNSFVAIASVPGDASPLWADGRLAQYFSMHRRRHFQVAKVVDALGDDVTVTSRLLAGGSADGLTVLPYSEPWVGGRPLLDAVVDQPSELDAVVRDWAAVARKRFAEAAPGEGVAFDLLPHNVHYVDGRAQSIDDEWRATTLTERDAVLRGALVLVRDLLDLAQPEHWGAESWVELVKRVALSAGEPADDADIERAILLEADLQATVGGAAPGSPMHERTKDEVERELRRQLVEARQGENASRAWESHSDAVSDAVATRDVLFATGLQLDEARERQLALQREVAELRSQLERTLLSRSRSLMRRARRGVSRLSAHGGRGGS